MILCLTPNPQTSSCPPNFLADTIPQRISKADTFLSSLRPPTISRMRSNCVRHNLWMWIQRWRQWWIRGAVLTPNPFTLPVAQVLHLPYQAVNVSLRISVVIAWIHFHFLDPNRYTNQSWSTFFMNDTTEIGHRSYCHPRGQHQVRKSTLISMQGRNIFLLREVVIVPFQQQVSSYLLGSVNLTTADKTTHRSARSISSSCHLVYRETSQLLNAWRKLGAHL